MTPLVIDKNRLDTICSGAFAAPAADRLFRKQEVFFVGGNLPVYETLATMFDSFCMESTTLFFLTIGPQESCSQGIEMARQIKKNFHARLMVCIEPAVTPAEIERIYSAGADNLVFSLAEGSLAANNGLPPALTAARSILPAWGTAAMLPLGGRPAEIIKLIDRLLLEGIVPLAQVPENAAGLPAEQIAASLQYLVDSWDRHEIPLTAYLPLIQVLTPLVDSRPGGLLRGFMNRLRDRQQLVRSDLRRHLRVHPAEDSLDSAGL